MSLLNGEQKEKNVSEYFFYDNQNLSIRELLKQISTSLSDDLIQFDSENFEPLKMKSVIEKFTVQISKQKLASVYVVKNESVGDRHDNYPQSGVLLKTIQSEECNSRRIVIKSGNLNEIHIKEPDPLSENNNENNFKRISIQEYIDD